MPSRKIQLCLNRDLSLSRPERPIPISSSTSKPKSYFDVHYDGHCKIIERTIGEVIKGISEEEADLETIICTRGKIACIERIGPTLLNIGLCDPGDEEGWRLLRVYHSEMDVPMPSLKIGGLLRILGKSSGHLCTFRAFKLTPYEETD